MKKIFCAFLIILTIQLQSFAISIPQGTLVVVQSQKIIDADDVKLGDTVKFSTVQPVKSNGKIIFNTGTEVFGKITTRKNNGILGILGELEISEFQIITQDNKILRLTGIISDKGENRYWANVGWIFVFPLLFIKGNDGKIFPSRTYMLYTAEDMDL